MRRGRRELMGAAVWAAIWTVGATGSAHAQWREDAPRDPRPEPSAYIGIAFLGADPVGEFGRNVDDGFGLGLEGRFPISATGGALSLRLDGGFVVYGHESRGLCFPPPVGCRIGVDLDTWNSIGFVGIGPEVAAPGSVSPYLNGTVGLTWFYTNSSLSGADDWDSNFNTTNYSDWVTSARVGGGVRFRVGSTSRGPFLVDLGAQYHRNGVADYLREGDILDHPDGSITLLPRRTEANMVIFQVGMSFAVGGGGGYDDDHPGHRRR